MEDLYSQTGTIVAGTAVLAAVNAVYYAGKLPGWCLALWGGVLAAAVVGRLLTNRSFRARRDLTRAEPWRGYYIGLSVLLGAAWGFFASAAVRFLAPETALVALITVLGVTSSAVATASASKLAFRGLSAAALVPLGAVLVLHTDTVFTGVGVMTLTFVVIVNLGAARVHATIRTSIAFGLTNERLVGELAELSHKDALTGLNNRRGLLARFAALEDEPAQAGHMPAMLLCDVDHFKAYNDELGHLQGDDCLRQVALGMQNALRPTDVIARYGGEEFAILLPSCEPAQLYEIGERVRQAVEALRLPHPSSPVSRYVTISVGACGLGGELATTIDQALALADTTLYRAKASGRNYVAVAGELARAPVASGVAL